MTFEDEALVHRAVALLAERRQSGRGLTTSERGVVAQAARICEAELLHGRPLPEGLAARLAGRQ